MKPFKCKVKKPLGRNRFGAIEITVISVYEIYIYIIQTYCRKVSNKNGNEINYARTHVDAESFKDTACFGTAYGNRRPCVVTSVVIRFELLLCTSSCYALVPARESRRRESIVFTRRVENTNASLTTYKTRVFSHRKSNNNNRTREKRIPYIHYVRERPGEQWRTHSSG